MNNIDELQQSLADYWSEIDPRKIANTSTRYIMDDLGDWDPPIGIKPKVETIPLAIGIPDSDSLPREALRSAAINAFSKHGEAAFVYGFGPGYGGLRHQLAERYTRDRGLPVTHDWFQLCNGSSGAIDLICRTLVEPDDVIICESPTYMGTLRNFRAMQADVRSIPMDEQGILLQPLESLIEELVSQGRKIKFIYTISTFQNPTGATLSKERRIALLRIAAQHNILILDDDAYGELYFDSQPPHSLSSLSGGYGVLTVGTFSKIIATGLRIGWIHGHPSLIALFGKMRFAMGLNQLMVRVISDYIDDGKLDKHANLVRGIYRDKMETLANALDKYAGDYVEFDRPKGGFYLWLKVKNGLKANDVWRTAAEEGVSFTQGVNFFPDRSDPEQHLRIAFAWTQADQLEEAARRIGIACRRVKAGDVASDD